MWAFKNDKTVIDEDAMNEILNQQDDVLIYAGTSFSGKSSSSGASNYLQSNDWHHATVFNSSGNKTITRVQLHLDSTGQGADLTVSLMSSAWTAAGTDGTALATITIPAIFLPSTANAAFSVPLFTTALSTGTDYTIVVTKTGDADDHIHILGAGTSDNNYPLYRRLAASGAWTAIAGTMYATVFNGCDGMPMHENFGTNGWSHLTYSSGIVQKEFYHLPSSSGGVGIRQIVTNEYSTGDIWFRAITSTC